MRLVLLVVGVVLAMAHASCAPHYYYKTQYATKPIYDEAWDVQTTVLRDNWLKEKPGETDAETNAACRDRSCLGLNLIHFYRARDGAEIYLISACYVVRTRFMAYDNRVIKLLIDGNAVKFPAGSTVPIDEGKYSWEQSEFPVTKEILERMAGAQSVKVETFAKNGARGTYMLNAENKENIKRFVAETHVPNAIDAVYEEIKGRDEFFENEEEDLSAVKIMDLYMSASTASQ
ncbi:MAG: hypothetical protein C4523_20590 [Myxococcales bacterium]|nr:MAG: hypothetical protein C4523_20590 [Myxococcales bacterium]